MSDRMASYLRTWWPLFLGHVAALLVTFVSQKFGIQIDGAVAFEAVGFIASAMVYWLGRKLELSEPAWMKAMGKFILSAGLTVGQPVYSAPPPPTPRHSID